MASSSAPLQEWLVIAPDFEGVLEKRLKVRNEHLAGLKKDPEDFWLWGGMYTPPYFPTPELFDGVILYIPKSGHTGQLLT
jgi:hypothetical protein